MPELHLWQPGFTYNTCGPFTKHLERIQKFRETDNLRHIYKNKLDNACFAHNPTYSHNKDLVKRTISDQILEERAYKSAIIPKYDGLASWIYKFFIRKQDRKRKQVSMKS